MSKLLILIHGCFRKRWTRWEIVGPYERVLVTTQRRYLGTSLWRINRNDEWTQTQRIPQAFSYLLITCNNPRSHSSMFLTSLTKYKTLFTSRTQTHSSPSWSLFDPWRTQTHSSPSSYTPRSFSLAHARSILFFSVELSRLSSSLLDYVDSLLLWEYTVISLSWNPHLELTVHWILITFSHVHHVENQIPKRYYPLISFS